MSMIANDDSKLGVVIAPRMRYVGNYLGDEYGMSGLPHMARGAYRRETSYSPWWRTEYHEITGDFSEQSLEESIAAIRAAAEGLVDPILEIGQEGEALYVEGWRECSEEETRWVTKWLEDNAVVAAKMKEVRGVR